MVIIVCRLGNMLHGLSLLNINFFTDKELFEKLNRCCLHVLKKFPETDVENTIRCIKILRVNGFAYDDLFGELKTEIANRANAGLQGNKSLQFSAAMDSWM